MSTAEYRCSRNPPGEPSETDPGRRRLLSFEYRCLGISLCSSLCISLLFSLCIPLCISLCLSRCISRPPTLKLQREILLQTTPKLQRGIPLTYKIQKFIKSRQPWGPGLLTWAGILTWEQSSAENSGRTRQQLSSAESSTQKIQKISPAHRTSRKPMKTQECTSPGSRWAPYARRAPRAALFAYVCCEHCPEPCFHGNLSSLGDPGRWN